MQGANLMSDLPNRLVCHSSRDAPEQKLNRRQEVEVAVEEVVVAEVARSRPVA